MTYQRHLENSETLANGRLVATHLGQYPGLHGDVTLLPGVTSSLYGELELVVMMRGKEILSKRSSMWSSPSLYSPSDSKIPLDPRRESAPSLLTYVCLCLFYFFYLGLPRLALSINDIIDNYSKLAKSIILTWLVKILFGHLIVR